jgi:hypothetical protein
MVRKNAKNITSIVELYFQNQFHGCDYVLSNNVRKQMFDINPISYNVLFRCRHDKNQRVL